MRQEGDARDGKTEQLQILQQGVAAWNTWREQYRDIRPDLTGADLLRADRAGAAVLAQLCTIICNLNDAYRLITT